MFPAIVDKPVNLAQHGWDGAAHIASHLLAMGQKFIRWEYAIDETPALRVRGAEEVAGKAQFFGS